MKMMNRMAMVLVLVTMVGASYAAETTPAPATLDSLRVTYDAAADRIAIDTQKQKDDALSQYGVNLESILTALKQKGDIDGYTVVEEETNRFKDHKTILPNNSNASISNAVSVYQKQVLAADTDSTRRKTDLLKAYVTALTALIKDLMGQNKIDAAKIAREEKRAVENMLAEMDGKFQKAQESAAKIDISGMWIDGWNTAAKWEVSQTDNRILINSRNMKWEGTIDTNGIIRINGNNDVQKWVFIPQLSADGRKLYGIVTWEDGKSAEWSWQKEEEIRKYTPSGKKTIPKEAVEFKGHHYMLFTDTSEWDKANFLCRSRDGHLAVISDAEENNFVYSLMFRQMGAWIGASKDLGMWRWCTSVRFDYQNWNSGEPNGGKALGLKACMYGAWKDNESWRGKWDDRPGKGISSYVCEWDY